MRRFFDTNLLVYLFDGAVRAKQARAQELLQQAVREGFALLSTQVLQEFFVAVTRKLAVPLSHEEAERAVRDLAQLPTVEISAEMVVSAIAVMRRYRLSFWDSLIVQAGFRAARRFCIARTFSTGRPSKHL